MSRRRRTGLARFAWTASLAGLVVVFVGLAIWQVERRAWKHALIAQVEQRASAAAVEAPDRASWPRIDAAHDAYRRVTVTGTFVPAATTFVRAVTALGSGYWVITPLRRVDGTLILVDRGFVTSDARASTRVDGSAAPITVTGLLRITEPKGGFMTTNDPAADRWVSRDVQSIATARGLADVAPYFIDADAKVAQDAVDDASHGVPVGGLTVIAFTDNHLLYAVIWSLLALLCAVATVRAWRGDGRASNV